MVKKETTELQIPKKSGGTRTIVSPSTSLKARLRRLNHAYAKATSVICEYAHGFVPGRNVVTAAMKHRGFAYTLSCDLEDFFDRCVLPHALWRKMIQRVRQKTPALAHGIINLHPDVFYNGRLAQGLPTSPSLANVAVIEMDEEIVAWLSERDPKAVYTRYADDLSFSSDNKDLLLELKRKLPEIVANYNHSCHPRKWSLQSASFGKRIICGIAIGDKNQPLTATRQQRRRLRAMQHHVDKGDNRRTTVNRVKGLREWTRTRLPVQEVIRTRLRGLLQQGVTEGDVMAILEAYQRKQRWTLRRVIEKLPCRHIIKAYEHLGNPKVYVSTHDKLRFAFKLVAVFGPDWKAWLDAAVATNVTYHDAMYWLPTRVLPEDGLGLQLLRWTRANPEMPTRQRDLSVIAANWLQLSVEDRKLPLGELLRKSRVAKYKDAKHAGFAEAAAKADVPADKYEKYETKWLAAIASPDKECIPRGVIYSAEGYRGEMLLRDNPEALWAGKYVNCCQYPGGGAGSSAWHAVKNARGGIFAVYYRELMIAQSWVWRKGDTVVFDNVESLSNSYSALPAIYDEAASWLIDKLGIREVRVGGHNDIPVNQWESARELLSPPKDCYSDANNSQRVIARSKLPRKQNESSESES